MQKVIIVNLNGNAYQLDEDGYHALRAYLDHAEGQLASNPDKVEIIGDLEQAIAEKCQRYLSPHKTVVTLVEIEQVLKEMGPVEKPAGDTEANGAAKARAQAAADAPKRLYRIRETGMIGGICAGLGAYADIDPTIVRVIFVLLAIVTHGAWILVYVVLMFVIPVASTSEERAAAQGLPFTAQELIDQAKTKYSAFHDKAFGHKWWKPKKKVAVVDPLWVAPAAAMPSAPYRVGYGRQLLVGILVPIFAMLRAALTVMLVLAIVALVNNGQVFGIHLPPEMPMWVGIVILVVVYQAVVAPFRVLRYAWSYNPATHNIAAEVWGGVIWLGFLLLFFWFAYEHEPVFREFLRRLPNFDRRWLQQV